MSFESREVFYCGLPLQVDYHLIEGEPQERYHADGGGYPGSGDEVEILEVYLGEFEVSEIIDLDKLKTSILEL